MHSFLSEIKKYPDLAKGIRFDMTELPDSYIGKNRIKAILLGADPTNYGIKDKPGLIKLKTVFGIDSDRLRCPSAPGGFSCIPPIAV